MMSNATCIKEWVRRGMSWLNGMGMANRDRFKWRPTLAAWRAVGVGGLLRGVRWPRAVNKAVIRFKA